MIPAQALFSIKPMLDGFLRDRNHPMGSLKTIGARELPGREPFPSYVGLGAKHGVCPSSTQIRMAVVRLEHIRLTVPALDHVTRISWNHNACDSARGGFRTRILSLSSI
jgi:hypothetical protein